MYAHHSPGAETAVRESNRWREEPNLCPPRRSCTFAGVKSEKNNIIRPLSIIRIQIEATLEPVAVCGEWGRGPTLQLVESREPNERDEAGSSDPAAEVYFEHLACSR